MPDYDNDRDIFNVHPITADDLRLHMNQYVDLLKHAVDDGASIGFMPPLDEQVARDYWNGVANSLENDALLLFAFTNKLLEPIYGTVQLAFSSMPSHSHRGEVKKLIVHTEHRRLGYARWLMGRVELEAQKRHMELLVLDTREGDAAENLYQSLGYERAGKIPYFVRNDDGDLEATVLYYKKLS